MNKNKNSSCDDAFDIGGLPVRLAGVDEVGRGPLAGPVVAAAVILDPANPVLGLRDSKQLTERRREQLCDTIQTKALAWALGRAEVEEIDRLNILQASLLAMQRAVRQLDPPPEYILVDGNRLPADLPCAAQAVIKGDSRVEAISAASILAKVSRDREMQAMEERYPGYGFAQHKGYPTKVHMKALEEIGISEIHRCSFAPVRRLVAET